MEFLHDFRWRLRAEALYVDLGSETHDLRRCDSCSRLRTAVAKWDDQFWVVATGPRLCIRRTGNGGVPEVAHARRANVRVRNAKAKVLALR